MQKEASVALNINNIHLKIQLSKLESQIQTLENEIQVVEQENYELSQLCDEADHKLIMKIEKESENYIAKIKQIENDEAFILNQEVNDKIRELEFRANEFSQRKNDSNTNYLVYLIMFFVGIWISNLV
ncbi:hypothetical protein SteCoe_22541 [Stentor coeruleus]|uniref:Uncharacterized protein n=1 Tax=Stentor coeruleus TaxID=5963 RepID=A0A1R2BM10_9CILI|nr:hypothetical protein SteCoe_22541 [Stentor coeruleus]